MKIFKTLFTGGVLVAAMACASASPVTLPDSSTTTTVTATVAEQAVVSIPAAISFTVNDINAATAVDVAPTVTLTDVVLADGHKVTVSVNGEAGGFHAPAGGTNTWAASDLSWTAPSTDSGSGSSGTLSGSTPQLVATSGANVGGLVVSSIPFSLASKANIDRAGDHTMTLTWTIASL